MLGAIRKVFGTKNERELKGLAPLVDHITSLEPGVRALSDGELAGKTVEFKERLAAGEALDHILPEAFAVVRETAARVLGERPFDVQVLGGVVLHQGRIAEMKTGEGKTLAATMPIYLNALTGKGAHVVTVNDYLAKRDAEWMGGIYNFLGLSVGVILPNLSDRERQQAYGADITYGTNNEFGFDYLRDNMKYDLGDLVQRELHYAIVDEVDSILIDEARTPLIISGPVEHSTVKDFAKMRPMVSELYRKQKSMVDALLKDAKKLLDSDGEDLEEAGFKLLTAYRGGPKERGFMELMEDPAIRKLLKTAEEEASLAKRLPEVDERLYFVVEERERNAYPTEKGKDLISKGDPRFFHVPDIYYELHQLDNDESLDPEEREEKKNLLKEEYEDKVNRNHVISQLLKAYALFEKDVEYVVKDGQIIIVDEFTGRLLPGRRYSDGLHQALEAKEGVQVERENQTLATITFQNYFRMYDKLAGMTGTADTEAAEFKEIYNLDVVVIPTNREMIRADHSDQIYKTEREKMAAAVDEIKELNRQGRPVLVGTVSIDKSERISKMLKKEGIQHAVLNAKHHEKEAHIIAHAGERATVTIATNMAGRGTDIKLGPGVVDLGGLHILGTERHESRRVDNQLRGRSGRQGDAGSSRFYLSLEDDLMRIFAAERIANLMEKVGIEEGEPIEHGLVTKAIESAQRRVEGHNFNVRKQLLEYDTVMNQHRELIYEQRKMALSGEGLKESVQGMMEDLVDGLVAQAVPEKTFIDDWDLRLISEEMFRYFTVAVELDPEENLDLTEEELREYLLKKADEAFDTKEAELGEEVMEELMKWVTLRLVDEKWREHLVAMESLREGIGLRGYGQKDPLVEYKKEGHALFQEMIEDIKKETVSHLFRIQIVREEQVEELAPKEEPMTLSHGDPGAQTVKRSSKKIGRNAPCPCGSGKKYKKCCGA